MTGFSASRASSVDPVVAFDRLAEALGDDPRRAEVIEVGNQEAELVAAEAGVELLAGAELRRLLRDQVVGPDLFAEQTRDAVDDAVAERVTERVVVPLERGDVDQADRAPAAALLEREERLELLDEAPEVHQPGLRIAVHAIGQVGDEVLEVLGDAAHGRVARGQFVAHAIHALGEPG